MNYTDANPDYSTYSLDELLDALSTIDESIHPDRANVIKAEISRRQNLQSTNAELNQTDQSETQAKTDVARVVPVVFHGNAKEYFNIWIVNLLLSIVTLGIYSAWATVRNHRYFYSNTEIDGHRFSYLAKPKQILIGRTIAVGLFAIYFVASSMSPIAGMVAIIVIFALTPVLICLGASFRMRMTAYRNIRFNFHKNYGRAYLIFVVYGIIAMFSFGFLYPWFLKKIDEFLYSHCSYGDRKVQTDLKSADYYVASIITALIAFGCMLVLGMIVGVVTFAAIEGSSLNSESSGVTESLILIATFLLYALVYFAAGSFYSAYIRNHIYNTSAISGVARFESSVTFGGLFILRMTNLFLLVVSLGFLMPWVKVRSALFYANASKVIVLENADSVLADQEQSGNAIGEEVAGAFDVDIAIG